MSIVNFIQHPCNQSKQPRPSPTTAASSHPILHHQAPNCTQERHLPNSSSKTITGTERAPTVTCYLFRGTLLACLPQTLQQDVTRGGKRVNEVASHHGDRELSPFGFKYLFVFSSFFISMKILGFFSLSPQSIGP